MTRQQRNAFDTLDVRHPQHGRDDRSAGLRPRAARAWLAALLLAAAGNAVAAPNLAVDLAGPATFVPGTTTAAGAYTFTVTNSDDTSTNTVIGVDFPTGATVTAWTCTASGGSNCGAASSGTGDINRTDTTVANGGQLVYAITVQFGAGVPGNLSVSASADAAGELEETDSLSLTRTARSALSVAKTSALATYVPGGSGRFTITVNNAGPSDGLGIGLADTPAAGINIGAWTCQRSSGGACVVPSGSGSLNTSFDIPVGVTYTYTVPVTYAASASAASLANTATLALPTGTTDPAEVTDNNNQSTVSVARDPRTDLTLVFSTTQPGSTYVPGSDDNPLRLTVRNTGSVTVSAAPLVVDVPASAVLAGSGWACTPASACSSATGSGDVTTNLTLAAGAEVHVDFLLDFNSAATDATLLVPAQIEVDSAPGTDPPNDPLDIRASHSRSIERRADVRVALVSPPTPTSTSPGAPFLYEFMVTNAGPSDAGNFAGETGINLGVDFDTGAAGEPGKCTELGLGLSTPCWEVCPGSATATVTQTVTTCPAGTLVKGSGDFTATALKLRKNSSTTLRAYARSAQAASGALTTTATVALAATTSPTPAIVDGATANNTVAAVTQIQPSTDIEVVKTSSLGSAAALAGEFVDYTITVRNIGFEAANNLGVHDVFKLATAGDTLGFVSGSIAWQCSASAGACCTHNGAANTCGNGTPTPLVTGDAIHAAVDLPSLGTLTFTARGQVHPSAASADASDTLDNTATVTLPAGLADSDLLNNTSTVSTLVSNEPQLRLGKSLLSISESTPITLGYELILENDGPGRASNVTVSDPLDDVQFARDDATWQCEVLDNPSATACHAASGGAPIAPTVDIDAGGRIRIVVTVPTTPNAEGVVVNQAQATGTGVSVFSPVVSSNLLATGDLAISKTEIDSRTTAVPGTAIEYLITVSNTGDDDAFGARITDLLPPGLENASWSCSATTPVPGDLSFLAGEGGESGGVAMASSSDGRHLYVAGAPRFWNHDGDIATPEVRRAGELMVHQRDNVPGLRFGDIVALETEMQGRNDTSDGGGIVNGMRYPIDVALSPDDTLLFVLSAQLDGQAASLAMFNRVATVADESYGRLSFAGSLAIAATDFRPARLAVSGTSVYVSGTADVGATQDVGHVLVFRRSASTGMPTFDVAVTDHVPPSPGALALSIPDAALYVAASGAGTAQVARYRIDPAANQVPAGRLTWLASALDAGHEGITDFALAAAQRQLYALAGGSGKLVRFSTLGTGLVQSEVQNAGTAGDLSGRIALAPDGEHLLVAYSGAAPGTTGTLVSWRRNVTGGLALDETVADPDHLDGASDVAVTPDGRHVLVTASISGTGERQIAVFDRRAPDPVFGFIELERDGVDGVAGLDAPSDVAVAPRPGGEHVYAVSLAEGAISVYRRDTAADAASGTHLTHLQTITHGDAGVQGLERARRVHVSPDGTLVLVSSEDEDSVAVFVRNADGTLSWSQVLRDGVGGVDGLLGAHGMAMDHGSEFLYVAGGFEHAVAQFKRTGNTFAYLGVVKNGSGGATGMLGMRDLVVTGDNEHVLGVGTGSNAVVTLRRTRIAGANEGRLTFVQSRPTSGVYVSALATRQGDATDNQHIYAVGRDDDSLLVLRRVSDPSSSAYGSLSTLFEYRNVPGMDGPNDVAVSEDGRRVYVSAQYSDSVLVFDRDLNRNSVNYGSLVLVETRRDGVDGVDGIRSPYALAASPDSRNVYVAGFDDRALAAFAVGSGSSCSAAGGGDIDDLVNIGANGTLEYRIRAFIRADATGAISNEACVVPPTRFDDTDASNDCSTYTSTLTPKGNVSLLKSNDRPSSVAGEAVRYVVRVDNPGPSNLVHDPANGRPLVVTDLLENNPGLVPGSATWTCEASGSGTLDFVDVDSADADTPLAGVTDLVNIASVGPGAPGMLAAASVLDDAVVLFERDLADGRLVRRAVAQQGRPLVPGGGANLDSLAGARAVAASADGLFLYVASRVSDSITVFAIDDAGTATARLRLVEVQRNRLGLDQASHLILSPDATGRFLYVAGSNDDAIAVFSRNNVTGALTHVQSLQNGAPHGGGSVAGLDGVDHLVTDPDGEHLYAVSSSAGTLALLDRNNGTGLLTWRSVLSGAPVGGLEGAASAVFDSAGERLYVAAADGNRIVVLERQANGALPDFGGLHFHSSVQQGVGSSLGLVSPRRLVLTGDDAHLYVTAQGGSSIAWYGRDENDGSLRYLGQRSSDSADVLGLAGATGVAFDDASNQLYVAGTLDATIAQFSRQADSFCPASGSGDIDAVPVDIAAGGSVVFTIDATVSSTLAGNLVNVADVTTGSCTPPTALTCVDPDTANNSSEDVDLPSLQADLWITKTDGLAAFDGLAGATAVVGTDAHVYVAGATDNAIGLFRREHDAGNADLGALTFVEAIVAGEGGALGLNAVSDLALSPDGAHLYAVSPTENSVAVFARDDASGQLAYVQQQRQGVLGVTGMSGARALALSADGSQVYVAGQFANAVAAFARNTDAASADYGKLTFLGSVQHGVGGADGLLQPVSLAVAPDGQHVYALSATGNSIAVLLRNPNPGAAGFGQISFLRRYQGNVGGGSGLEGGRSLAIDAATGTHLYVLGTAPGTLAHFLRTPGTGELVLDGLLSDGDANVSGLAGAERLRLAGDGMLHVAATAADAVLTFTVDGNGRPVFGERVGDGDAAPGGGDVLGLDGVRDVLATPDGASAYTVAGVAAAISGFDRAGTTLGYRETFFDGLGGVAPGSAVTYTIVVGNAGPAAVADARVVDLFPSEFVSVAWTCDQVISTGNCAASGTGNLDTTVDLPVGTRVVFEATGVLANSVSGLLSNTATVASASVVDFDVSNNSATDGDTVLSPALDLHAEIVDVLGDAVPGDRIDYMLEVGNAGPTYAAGATLRDVLSDAVFDAAWTCSATPVAGVLTSIDSDAAGSGLMLTAVAASAFGQYVYAAASTDTPEVRPPTQASRVLVYARDPIDGSLVQTQALVQGADGVGGIDGAADLVLSSDERFVYVAGYESDAIAVFARNAADGTLTYMRRYEDGLLGNEGLGGVVRLLLAPGGTHLYAAGNVDDAIAVFSINAATGALTQSGLLHQGTGGIDGLNGVTDLAWSKDATHLFAIARENASIAAFARNAATGLLTAAALRQEFEANDGALLDPAAITAHEGRVWVASGNNGRVSAYEFDNGTATFSADALNVLDGLADPADLLFDPDQQRLYVALRGSNDVVLYSLLGEAAEELDRVASAGVQVLAFAPGLKQLYAGGAGVATFLRERGSRCPLAGSGGIGEQTVDIAPGGTLSLHIGGALYPNAIGALRYEVSVQPRDVTAELEPADNTAIDERSLQPAPTLSIDKTDNLASVVAGTPLTYRIGVQNGGVSAAIGARLRDAAPMYPAVAAGLLQGASEWSCAVAPPLERVQSLDAAAQPALQGVGRHVLSPDGRRLYAVNAARDALLVIERGLDGSLGALQEITNNSTLGTTTVSGLDGPSAVALSDDGRTVYVTGADANSLVVFTFDPDSNSHTWTQSVVSGNAGVVGMQGPRDVVASGTHVYVAAATSDSIVVLRHNEATGLLQFVERVRDGFGTVSPDTEVLRGVRRLVRSVDGGHLYSLAATSQSVASFAITPDDGKLRYLGVLRAGTVPGLLGARDLVSSPGDRHLYALGNAAIVRLDREADARLGVGATITAGAGLEQPRALAVDASGARLYLADAVGGVSVFARDWSSGGIAWRHRVAPTAVIPASDAALLPVAGGMLASLAAPGQLQRFDVRPLSYCHADAGSTDGIDTTLDLAVGGDAEFSYHAVVHPSARGVLQNVARIEPMAGSAATALPADATDTTQIRVTSALSVTKTGPADAVAGLPVQYELRVANAGPSDALDARVVDAMHAALQDVTWTCAASGTSSCQASGSGAIDVPVTLHVGDELVFSIDATVDPAFVGDLVNAVSLVAETGSTDPDTGDNSASVTTHVTAEVDLAIAKTNAVERVVAGAETIYTLDVSNLGPSDAPQARLRDLLPGARLHSATWTCTPSGGATCDATGHNSIDATVSLPAGSSLQVMLRAIVDDEARGELENTASIAVQGDPTELDDSNNQSTDRDAIDVVTDIRVALRDGYDPYDPASPLPLPYEIEVHNAGPSSASATTLSVTLPGPILTDAPPGCTLSGTLFSCDIGAMFGGEVRTIALELRVLPAAPGTYTVTAQAGAAEPDPFSGNNSATETTTLRTGADVVVSITRLRPVTVGDQSRYQIDLVNVGSVAANDVAVSAPVATGLLDATWTCSGTAACTANGVGDIVDTVDLGPGKRLRYELRATVDPSIPPSVDTWIEQFVEALVPDDADINPDNNSALDVALARHGIFGDSFEDPVIKRAIADLLQENAR